MTLIQAASPLSRPGQTAVPGRRKPNSSHRLVQGRDPGGSGGQAAPPAALQAEERSAAHRRADPLGRRQLHVRRRQRVRHHQEDIPGGGARLPSAQGTTLIRSPQFFLTYGLPMSTNSSNEPYKTHPTFLTAAKIQKTFLTAYAEDVI